MQESSDKNYARPGDVMIAGHPRVEAVRRLEREGLRCLADLGGEFGVETIGHTAKKGELAAGWRRFDAFVRDLEALEVRRVLFTDGGGRVIQPFGPDDRLRRIVARTAIRALYILGVKRGLVEVAVDSGGKASIAALSESAERIRPGWVGAPEMGAKKADVLESRVLLGADPEFVLVGRSGKIADASKYLPPDGSAGCDSVVRRGLKIWPLVELRPEPAQEPSEVVASLRRLLSAAARRFGHEPLVWRAGAWPVPGLPLGGHVHISGVPLTGERLRALDNAVALPLRLLEPPGAAARRPRYGALGDFRRQPHGGFEYRTPPSWLVSPRLAQGVLALAKIAVTHANELAASMPLDDDEVRDAFYGEGCDPLLRDSALRYYEAVRRTAGYRQYAADVDSVFEAVRNGRHWDECSDIRRKWGIK